ncbi:NtaA/DmoA family FMN-dependent monooxygenase [Streptomyces sp. NPDC051840]|uniref:NtaA/DmoA family FMN-dependent monooxygenase n=1 Tax=Streptomyces sp. NPDC051840 TaxID=3154752 RepID=UPI003424FE25
MADKEMLLGLSLSEAYGLHPGAWRVAAREAYTDVDVFVQAAERAEQGGMDFLFVPDRVFLHEDLMYGPPFFTMDPLMVLSAVAYTTDRIGLVTSASTSFHEPYTIARQFRALDVMSHGRAGWNAIPSYEPEAFANHGMPVPPREKKYERLHEAIQITQALWGSWRREAGQPDKTSGRFADMHHIRPINLQGNQVGSRGPLQIPPSEQGQPVIFMPFAGGASLDAAARYADGVVAMPRTPDEGRQQVELMRSLVEQAGRAADDVKVFPFMQFSLGVTERDAIEHRMVLDRAAGIDDLVLQLAAVLGITIDDVDTPLSDAQIAALTPHPRSPRATRIIELATQGLTPREILAWGVISRGGFDSANPGMIGSPEQAADMIEEWMHAGAGDGLTVVLSDVQHDLPLFVEHVVPILRQRGLRPEGYLGSTLRDHLGLKEQLGLAPRISSQDNA